MTGYDSTIDAKAHIANIQWVYFHIFEPEMRRRILNHDKSKLEEPEKACYDKWIPELRKVKFDDPTYDEIKAEMKKDGFDHHVAVNRHHPEHFENGIAGMNLVDFVEHILDCYAASLRSDTGFKPGIETVMKRNDYPETLKSIVRNTAEDLLDDTKPTEQDLDHLDTWINKHLLQGSYIESDRSKSARETLDYCQRTGYGQMNYFNSAT